MNTNLPKHNQQMYAEMERISQILQPAKLQIATMNNALAAIAEQSQKVTEAIAAPFLAEQQRFQQLVEPLASIRFPQLSLGLMDVLESVSVNINAPSLTAIQSALDQFSQRNAEILALHNNTFDNYTSALNVLSERISAWESLSDHLGSTISLSADEAAVDLWYDSAFDILDDMTEQGWIQEDDEKTYKSNNKKETFKSLPLHKKVLYILEFIAALTTITSSGFDVTEYITTHALNDTPAVHKQIDTIQEKLIIGQTLLINSVSDHLAEPSEATASCECSAKAQSGD